MTYIAAACFFTLALGGACAILHLCVREHWQAIVAALFGSAPVANPLPRRKATVVRVQAIPPRRPMAAPLRAAA